MLVVGYLTESRVGRERERERRGEEGRSRDWRYENMHYRRTNLAFDSNFKI